MSVQDLTNTTWVFNSNVSGLSSASHQYNINFTSNGVNYTLINEQIVSNDTIHYDTVRVFRSAWVDEAYRTITITGGTDVTNAALISWLEANATQPTSSTTDFELSSLTWSTGAHTIRVKAKGTGYQDSSFSNSVTYAVYTQLDTPIAVLSNSTLSVTAVSHANAFEVYANDVLKATQLFTQGTNFNLDTLNLPEGTYTIKARCIDNTVGSYYTPSEMATAGTYTVLPQLDAPTNVSVSGTDATFDEVSNAESYELFVDGTSIGTYTPTSGYQVRLGGSADNGGSVAVFDGTDSFGTELLYKKSLGDDDLVTFDETVVCTTGHLFVSVENIGSGGCDYGTPSTGITGVSTEYGELYTVTQDGSIVGICGYGCFVEGTKILLTNGTTKNVEDITYDDELLVWNFYEGKLDSAKPRWIMQKRTASEYKKVLLSDGTELKLVGQGDNCHRLFNVTKQRMLYANECVGDEVATIHGIVTVLSCEKVRETVNYYNIITDTHYNLFAEGVLTSCRLSNKYKIEDMKYVGEPLISEEEEQEYFNKLASVAKER